MSLSIFIWKVLRKCMHWRCGFWKGWKDPDAWICTEKVCAAGRMLHGDYNYHNLIMLPGGMAVTNFEHLRIGIQAQDLYYFIRKAMEKCHWKQKLGREMLEAYQSVRKIEPVEKEYIGLCLAYPEKFWKAASSLCAFEQGVASGKKRRKASDSGTSD